MENGSFSRNLPPRPLVLAWALLLLPGCDALESLKETVEGYTETVAAEGFLLGVAEPTSDKIDLSGTPFDHDATLSVFLADAAGVSDLSSAPITGADVSIKNESVGDLLLTDEGGGLYRCSSENGLGYYPTENYSVTVNYGGSMHRMPGAAPYPANVDIELSHGVNEPLVIDLSSFDYDGVLVSVVDLMTTDVTFSNEPASIQEIYDFTHGSATVGRFEIPGSAFGSETLFAVGVAGMMNAEEDSFEEMNTLLSAFMLGQMKFYPVSTFGD